VTDQVAVVTGAGAGIGQGIAVTLARFGADVVVLDIDPDRGASTSARIDAAGRQSLAVQVDASDSNALREAIERVHAQFGRIDILVNNVGGVRPGPFLEQSERSWRRHVDLNLMSVFAATAAAAPVMVAGGRGGSIVNVASIEALRAAPSFAVYAACKAAMLNFTRTMALELGAHGIRVNAIAPDLIATPGLRGLVRGPVPDRLPPLTPEMDAGVARYVPLGSEGSVADCGGVVTFLCSPMGRYISGIVVGIDGGTWASAGWVRDDDGSGWQLVPEMVIPF